VIESVAVSASVRKRDDHKQSPLTVPYSRPQSRARHEKTAQRHIDSNNEGLVHNHRDHNPLLDHLVGEREQRRRDVDDAVMETNEAWAGLLRRDRNIGDFRHWKDHDRYRRGFERVLRDLKQLPESEK
jgi:hypothetical protein